MHNVSIKRSKENSYFETIHSTTRHIPEDLILSNTTVTTSNLMQQVAPRPFTVPTGQTFWAQFREVSVY